jgi:hypothetical protein
MKRGDAQKGGNVGDWIALRGSCIVRGGNHIMIGSIPASPNFLYAAKTPSTPPATPARASLPCFSRRAL